MGQFRNGPPEALVLALRSHLGLDEFVETGSYQGDTALWAADHFARVATIELSPQFHQAAQKRLSVRPNVRALCGESAAMLAGLVSSLNRPAMFWLDAHWSGGSTAGKEMQCPLLRELAAVRTSPLDHVILIDDARLFCVPPPPPQDPAQWPSLSETIVALEPERRHVVLYEDVLVAVPRSARTFLDRWLQDSVKAPRRRLRWLWKK